ncbi:TPA: hypothetical protein ACF3QL_003919 [Escherichia coli]|uniref:hypothetical protein n=1 Tax=Enterobacteriaceae TaxID=543 RepID=UPI0008545092|nr:hypothetical protein [Escherichia coli]EEW2516183.1 hypothetical protein [Escherichia coli]EFO0899348.1 hypothetical protein [Escherichia coli]EFO5053044.1 hypothetical protein [Escherichia coli]EFO5587379.1 hypothetical protein [Escherichia coli]EHC2484069.1 hypothetical protein [Escherichia coli]
MRSNYGYLSNLAGYLQGVARVIKDGERVQDECPTNLKSALLEVAHALDGEAVRVVYPPEGKPEVVNARCNHRVLTWRERMAIWLLGGKLEIRP